MSYQHSLHLFEAFGVELEYMIVDVHTLAVKPITDKVIYEQVGAYISEVEMGEIAWSNELVLHVIELKTNGPASSLAKLPGLFQAQILHINAILGKYGAKLLPTGMHPFMNPFTETKLWPHEYNAVYEAYDNIFNCKGHGWSNLQSTHINLPFADDAEFGRLHAAIRLLLPIIPALSASSPVMDGTLSGFTDTRLEVYRKNQSKIPSIAGYVIPEAVFTKADYEEKIFNCIYQDINPYDSAGILQDEFLNSRGAIARFDRGAIEIRIIDIQECPQADMAILSLVVAVLKLLVNQNWQPLAYQKNWDEKELSNIFLEVIKNGTSAEISNKEFLQVFGLERESCTARDLWIFLVSEVYKNEDFPATYSDALEIILTSGNLSERITKALGPEPSLENIKKIYNKLSDCLQNGVMFI